MINDVRTLGSDLISADLCIVGGGAAGLCMAAEFAQSPLKVIVLEAGGEKATSSAQDFYKGELKNDAHSRPDHFRVRAIGGSSRVWGGCCLPLDQVDFSERPWVDYPGWAISYEDLSPYYRRALEAAEAGPSDQPAPSPIARGLTNGDLHTVLERFSRPTDFAKRWRRTLATAQNVSVCLNLAATAIRLEPNGHSVQHIEARRPDGGKVQVQASRYVLALGGLESTRLLLASSDVRPTGVGNDHDWVGRGYMAHVAGIFGEVQFGPNAKTLAAGYEQEDSGVFVKRRLLVSEAAQRRHRILNLGFRLGLQYVSDPSRGDPVLSAIHLYKSVLDDRYTRKYRSRTPQIRWSALRHGANLVRNPLRLMSFSAQVLAARRGSDRWVHLNYPSPGNRYALEFHGEQAVNRDSRINLSSARDRFGTPRLSIDWRYSRLDVKTVLASYRILETELRRTGIGSLTYDARELEEHIAAAGAYGGHHIGSLRMSADPKDGVVDRDCRVHGVHNLYVASSAVMPTSGQANPTLTILALAYRLADHLRGAPPATDLRRHPAIEHAHTV